MGNDRQPDKFVTTAQLSDEYWQKLAEDTRREVDRITNFRNLLNLKDLAEKAEECDRKALLAKRAELRNTFMDLAEQYRFLTLKVKASQKEHASSAKPLVEKIAAHRLAERLSLFGEAHPTRHGATAGLKRKAAQDAGLRLNPTERDQYIRHNLTR
jgi:hypothetical protein